MASFSAMAASLAYSRFGEGFPVVFLHGGRLNKELMAEFCEPAFAGGPSGFTRIYLDLPGHGESPAGGTTGADVLTAFLAFLDELQLPRVALAGYSYGGYIGQAAAFKRSTITSLFLVSSFASPHDNWEPARNVVDLIDPGLVETIGEKRIAEYLKRGNRATTATLQLFEEQLQPAIKGNYRSYMEFQSTRETWDLECDFPAAMRKYKHPVFVLNGSKDKMIGTREAQMMQDNYSIVTRWEECDEGHNLIYERRGLFTSYLKRWLETVRE